jgi:hypothetical protein
LITAGNSGVLIPVGIPHVHFSLVFEEAAMGHIEAGNRVSALLRSNLPTARLSFPARPYLAERPGKRAATVLPLP